MKKQLTREEILSWSEDQQINTIIGLYSLNLDLAEKLNEASETIITLSNQLTTLSNMSQEMCDLINDKED